MNIDSTYNVILGRGCLGKMKDVASPYHQKLKFPSKEGIVVTEESKRMHATALGLAKSVQAGGKNDVAEELLIKGKKKRNGEIVNKPETSHQRGKAVKNQ